MCLYTIRRAPSSQRCGARNRVHEQMQSVPLDFWLQLYPHASLSQKAYTPFFPLVSSTPVPLPSDVNGYSSTRNWVREPFGNRLPFQRGLPSACTSVTDIFTSALDTPMSRWCVCGHCKRARKQLLRDVPLAGSTPASATDDSTCVVRPSATSTTTSVVLGFVMVVGLRFYYIYIGR